MYLKESFRPLLESGALAVVHPDVLTAGGILETKKIGDMAEEYGAEQLIYAHSHGERRFHDSIEGEFRGRQYRLVSGDYLKWVPLKILD